MAIDRMNSEYRDVGEFKCRKVSLAQLGSGIGDVVHVDHIVPLFKGGAGFGLSNIQVICVACHRQKTIEERVGDTFDENLNLQDIDND